MRVNVYEEEITDDVQIVWTTADTGKRFLGVRLFLKSAKELHHSSDDDDRSAVTIWLGNEEKAKAFFARIHNKLTHI